MIEQNIHSLLNRFKVAVQKHHQATLLGDWQVANEQAKEFDEVFRQLRAIGDTGREALVGMMFDQDDAVALMASTFSLKYSPTKSLEVLQQLTSKPGLIGFSAKQAIQRWLEGSWQIE